MLIFRYFSREGSAVGDDLGRWLCSMAMSWGCSKEGCGGGDRTGGFPAVDAPWGVLIQLHLHVHGHLSGGMGMTWTSDSPRAGPRARAG